MLEYIGLIHQGRAKVLVQYLQPCRDPQRRFTIMRNLLPKILLAHLIFWGKDVEISNHKCFLEPIPFTPFRCLINVKYNPKNHIEGVAGFS